MGRLINGIKGDGINNSINATNCEEDLDGFEKELQSLKDRLGKLKALEATIFQEEASYRSELSRRKKRLDELKRDYPNVADRIKEFRVSLQTIEQSRPTTIPFILWVAMGSAKLILPDRERILYKASYERFKVFATVTHLILSLILLLIPDHPWLDAASNFFLLYAYSTMTLREHILRLNGSAMQLWWVWHHYLCVVLSGVLVVWPAGPTYYRMRNHLLLFMVYIAAVQILQYKYQMSRLYTLRAISRVGPMQTTTDSASVHIFNSLGFLLPFLLVGHWWQFYTSYRFWKLAYETHWKEWQLMAIGVLFGMIALGNMTTTLYVVLTKWKRRRLTSNGGSINGSASTSPIISHHPLLHRSRLSPHKFQ